jgi:hypothetical protein
MGHPELDNPTPFHLEPLFLADEDGRPLVVPLLKATYVLSDRGLIVAELQAEPNLAGEMYGEPGRSSYRYEPEGCWPKPATDVVLLGEAFAPRRGTKELLVSLQVGPLKKALQVVGDRVFFKSIGGPQMSDPVPFERIPLQWERAFGGWDRSSPDVKKHSCEPRNPVGTGYRAPGSSFEEGVRAPNLEEPGRPFRGWGDRCTPAGFGFVSPDWEPRRQYAGTYDERWTKERSPLLPQDFDRRFLNAGSPGLVAPGHLRGDEVVSVTGVSAAGLLAFRLPGVAAPTFVIQHAGRPDQNLPGRLDTVIIDTEVGKVFFLWRAQGFIREPSAVRSVQVKPGVGMPVAASASGV